MNESAEASYLLSPRAVRERSLKIFERALEGKTHFNLHLDRLDEVADFVKEVTLRNYPDLKIPFHSRWGHFHAGGVDRLKELDQLLSGLSMKEKARSRFDLAVVSVLLDAGAGANWAYREGKAGTVYSRSEGLAVASFRMFLDGRFSSDPKDPLRVDSKALRSMSLPQLAEAFQVSEENPLVGLEGRLSLLKRLGEAMDTNSEWFPRAPGADYSRPGDLLLAIRSKVNTDSSRVEISAGDLLRAVLLGFGPIWPGRIQLPGVNLGDVWEYPDLKGEDRLQSLVPFHKLSQWLTYSLIDPAEEYGMEIRGVEELTGLAEYRNGGLLLDRNLISLKDPTLREESHRADSPLVIEWRALTVTLLDRIADQVRASLGLDEKAFPLAKVLEGGTWHAGRQAAKELRQDGGPPLKILSDGTVF